MWYLLSTWKPTKGYLTCLGTRPPKPRYTRPRDRFESDLTDKEWNLVEPCLPPPGQKRTPPQDRPPGGVQRDPVCARHRRPVAGTSSLFSAGYNGPVLFPSLEPQRGHRPDDGQASCLRAQAGGTLRDPDGCGDRHPIGEDDGERRTFGLRRGQEGQGAASATSSSTFWGSRSGSPSTRLRCRIGTELRP